ncbi:unnamed protein product (macronuclear) [Paramecium tetraurelia]|uniref:Transmembrane protein n=1 Tax=Paramecium tetraurelia TaxID=5888 RepID=A0E902_PARTE|nr:uncharacterized protein GSPATT00024500001 [Paramecium tetraurelia]CAK91769.1 unnamed protein product [Paramecium tetraurelia]|eukprot:XP_001459166.1 hypothetical protein (macronuclear) [Paramecium tetraurelia strain d4-2]
MTIYFHKLLDAETERQYNCFQNEQIIKTQNKQKVLILLLLSVFTIQKGIEKSWTSLTFNIFGFIFITISFKFVKKASMYYKYLLLVIVLIFNMFYPLNRYMGTLPNQDTYLDGYFICLGSLSILNSVEAYAKYIVMIPILAFNLYVGPYTEAVLWSQFLKFGIMTVMDIQFGIQQEICRRKQFSKLNCNKIIQNYFNSQDLFDIFKVKFDENVKSIKLSSLLEKQKFNEFQQLDFKQRIRKILVHPKKYNTEMNKNSQQNQFQMNKINLETFLLYYLKGIKPKADFKLFESFKNKLKVDLEEISVNNLGQNEISTFNSKQITPQALIILKQHQISTKIKKLKLKQENYKLIIKYFISIFNSSFKKCLTILQDFNQFCDINITSQQQLIFREHHTQLNKAWNSFRNMVDFMQLSCNINPLATFNILLMVEQLTQAVKYLHHDNHDNAVDLEIINKLKSSFVVSNNAKMKQLFLNLFYYILDLNYGKIYIMLEEEQNSDDNIIYVKIKYQSESIFTKSELQSFPIINPMSFSDLQHNSKSILNLEIPISIWLVRLLGPKDKIIIRKMKQQYELEFQLYKILTADMSLQQYYNIKLENQVILQQDEQPLITNCISLQPCINGQ